MTTGSPSPEHRYTLSILDDNRPLDAVGAPAAYTVEIHVSYDQSWIDLFPTLPASNRAFLQFVHALDALMDLHSDGLMLNTNSDERARGLLEYFADALASYTGWVDPAGEVEAVRRRRVLTGRERRVVFERDAYRCQECGGWSDLTIDHVEPFVNGGADELSNFQTLCRSCNSRKGPRRSGF